MFQELKNQAPIIAVAPIKMMRYVISDDFDLSNNEIDFKNVNDLAEKSFSTLKGKLIFKLNNHPINGSISVLINSLSLRDQENGIYMHDMSPLKGELTEFNDELTMKGECFIDLNGQKYIAYVHCSLKYAQNGFFEIQMGMELGNGQAIYSMTLIQKELQSSYALAFASVA